MEDAHGIAAALPLSVLLITTKRIWTLLLTASPGTAANTTTYSFNVSVYNDGPLFLVYQTQEEGETLPIAGRGDASRRTRRL